VERMSILCRQHSTRMLSEVQIALVVAIEVRQRVTLSGAAKIKLWMRVMKAGQQ